MPSHPDRVRQNYHTITIHELGRDLIKDEEQILIAITKQEIASAMTRRQVVNLVLRKIQKGILDGG